MPTPRKSADAAAGASSANLRRLDAAVRANLAKKGIKPGDAKYKAAYAAAQKQVARTSAKLNEGPTRKPTAPARKAAGSANKSATGATKSAGANKGLSRTRPVPAAKSNNAAKVAGAVAAGAAGAAAARGAYNVAQGYRAYQGMSGARANSNNPNTAAISRMTTARGNIGGNAGMRLARLTQRGGSGWRNGR